MELSKAFDKHELTKMMTYQSIFLSCLSTFFVSNVYLGKHSRGLLRGIWFPQGVQQNEVGSPAFQLYLCSQIRVHPSNTFLGSALHNKDWSFCNELKVLGAKGIQHERGSLSNSTVLKILPYKILMIMLLLFEYISPMHLSPWILNFSHWKPFIAWYFAASLKKVWWMIYVEWCFCGMAANICWLP